MRVLILVPQQDVVSGNWITAQRLQKGLEGLGHQAVLRSVGLQDAARLRRQLSEHAPDVVLLLHAYRSGKPWLEVARDCAIPYLVMLTGTDINQGLVHAVQRPVIERVIKGAACVLLHNPLLAATFRVNHPELSATLHTLPAAISLGTVPYALRADHGLAGELPLFLCAAGLRPVKGQRELLPIFDRVAEEKPVQLVFCGPELDADYSKAFFSELAQRPWAHYLGVIPPPAMASALGEVDVVVNNSQSEGLANALLEAATLGVPILARNNPGNAAVVNHDVNGLLYDDDRECVRCAGRLLDREFRRQLSRPDPSYRTDQETQALAAILMRAAGHRP